MPLCRCGCGNETAISKKTGKFREYCEGHQHSSADPFTGNYKITKNGCWEWSKSINKAGYGVFSWRGKRHAAHRFSYGLHHGPIPPNSFICHKCDNRKCVNPEHLYAGDNLTNIQDKVSRIDWNTTKILRGDKHQNRKLSEAKVAQAYQEWKSGTPLSKLAIKYGVRKSTIHAALTGITWTCVPKEVE